MLYWSFKCRMSAEQCHTYTTFYLQAADTSFVTWDCAELGSLCPQHQALWPFAESMLPLNTTQPPKTLHPISLGLPHPDTSPLLSTLPLRHKHSLNLTPSKTGFRYPTSKDVRTWEKHNRLGERLSQPWLRALQIAPSPYLAQRNTQKL